jgi:hypothetical protein
MVYFSEDVSRMDRLRLKKLDRWLEEYACDGLIGEELDPWSMQLGRSVQPTICAVEDIDDIEVLEATYLGDGIIEARCQVGLRLELDLNDEDDNTTNSEATMDITLEIHAHERKIAGHHVHDAHAPDLY